SQRKPGSPGRAPFSPHSNERPEEAQARPLFPGSRSRGLPRRESRGSRPFPCRCGGSCACEGGLGGASGTPCPEPPPLQIPVSAVSGAQRRFSHQVKARLNFKGRASEAGRKRPRPDSTGGRTSGFLPSRCGWPWRRCGRRCGKRWRGCGAPAEAEAGRPLTGAASGRRWVRERRRAGGTGRAPVSGRASLTRASSLSSPRSGSLRGCLAGSHAAQPGRRPSPGKALNNAVRCAMIQMVEGMIQLIEVILRTPHESLSQEQLISTGGIWEACDRVSCLPHDNLAAATLAISSCLELIKDALEEMEQMQAEGGASPGDLLEEEALGSPGHRGFAWTDPERQLLGPCKGLVKATKAGLRKLLAAMRTHGGADTAEQVAQLDALAEATAELSPSVDELVLSLCPPVNQLALRLNDKPRLPSL
uniref:Uncharacterized protein n=1 Tax=Naja naja TaxID=35670 RepID=A0A8C6XW82_NAJNA